MILRQLFKVVGARWRLIFLIFFATVATTAVVSFLLPKRYLATASMVVEFPTRDAMGASTFLPGTIAGFLATQVEIIKSDRVLSRVIDRLGLDRDPAVRAEWQKSTEGRGDIRKWISEGLAKDIVVASAREGAYINIEYESKDPAWAASVVNTLAEAFVQTSIDLRTAPSRDYATKFEEQARIYRSQLEAAQAKLSTFQRQSGIVTSDERVDVENLRLQELSTQLVQLQALVAESRSRNRTARASGDAMAEVVTNPLVQTLKSELSRAEARYQELTTRLGPNHPQILSAQAELAQLRSRLRTETDRIARSISATDSVNQQRLADTRAELERQRAKVLDLKQQRDQLALLQRDVDTAQKALDVLTQRATQTNIESGIHHSNVSIVTPATVPAEPSRPRPVLNIAVGSIFGLVLGLLAAVTLEGLQRPVRSSEDLLEAVGVPVLAVLPPAASTRAQRLIGDTGPSVAPLRLGSS